MSGVSGVETTYVEAVDIRRVQAPFSTKPRPDEHPRNPPGPYLCDYNFEPAI